MSILHCKKTSRLITQKENKQKCIFIYLQTFIFFLLILISRSIATHISRFRVGGKTTLQRDFVCSVCFFTFPTNMYTYTLYIYILCVNFTNKNGGGRGHKNITEEGNAYKSQKLHSRKILLLGLLPFPLSATSVLLRTDTQERRKRKKRKKTGRRNS